MHGGAALKRSRPGTAASALGGRLSADFVAKVGWDALRSVIPFGDATLGKVEP